MSITYGPGVDGGDCAIAGVHIRRAAMVTAIAAATCGTTWPLSPSGAPPNTSASARTPPCVRRPTWRRGGAVSHCRQPPPHLRRPKTRADGGRTDPETRREAPPLPRATVRGAPSRPIARVGVTDPD